MSWIDDVLADYGRMLGFETLAFNDDGVVSLRFETLGDLFIEQIDDGLLLYVTRTYERSELPLFINALSACHWEQNATFATNASQGRDGELIFSVVVPESDVNVPTIERAVADLGKLHDAAQEGSYA